MSPRLQLQQIYERTGVKVTLNTAELSRLLLANTEVIIDGLGVLSINWNGKYPKVELDSDSLRWHIYEQAKENLGHK